MHGKTVYTLAGCPTPGVYGDNCSLLCPRNCQQDRCDIVEGTCLGCILGFKGDRCNKSKAYCVLFLLTIARLKEIDTLAHSFK